MDTRGEEKLGRTHRRIMRRRELEQYQAITVARAGDGPGEPEVAAMRLRGMNVEAFTQRLTEVPKRRVL